MPKSTSSSLSLLQSLAEAPGAPGCESAVRTIFQQHLAPCGTLREDKLGSAICDRPGSGPRVMLTAHFDEVAFAVQNITSRGFLKIVALGGWWTHNLLAQRVQVITATGRKILGIIASTPPHFLSEGQRDKVMAIEHLFVDIGASSAQEVTEKFGIALGDPLVPLSEFTRLENPDVVVCKAFDNRVGCAVMVETMLRLRKAKLACALTAVGTVQEEVGCRGAVTAAATVKPDVALIMEGTPADDTPGMSADESQGALGAGPQIRLLDPTALMNRPLANFIAKIAKQEKIPHQIAVRRSGGTDAKSIHLAGEGVPCVVVGVPARYIHSHNAIVNLKDYEHTIQLMVAVIQSLDAKSVAKFTNFSASR
jgi:putative aminopeptidase FrvX